MLNSVALMGRLTADPELKSTSNDKNYARFTLAVSRGDKDNNTDFINCVAWNKTAEFISKYFSKGKLIALEGNIQTGSYQDKEGNKRKSFEVVAHRAHFVESKKKEESNDSDEIIEDDEDLQY